MKNSLCLIIFAFSSFLLNGQHNHKMDKSSHKFIENKGQWQKDILFYSKIPGAEIAIKKGEINYLLKDDEKYNSLVKKRHDGLLPPPYNRKQSRNLSIPPSELLIQNVLVKMKILGAQEHARYNGSDSFSEKRNYFIGNDEEKWARNIKSFRTVSSPNIINGIEFKVYHHNNSIKHEFHIDKQINYKKIKLEYSGYKSISINKDGELEIQTQVGLLKEDHPVAYQIIKGKYKYVKCEFQLNSDQTVSYSLGKKYNRRYPLVIDPQLIFSTASGSEADNWGNTACLDKEGNLYSGGTVFSTSVGSVGENAPEGFPATPGSFTTVFQGGDTDIGILKFDSSGQNLIYATYIGGNDSEIPTSMITNDKNELFILAVSGSTNFPASVNTFSGGSPFIPVGGYTFSNGSDIVIIKLSADGAGLIKSRYVGGPFNDGANFKSGLTSLNTALTIINYGDELRGELVIDEEDNIYVASSTNNAAFTTNIDTTTSFPVKNGFQENFGGGIQDGVVFKVHHSMDSLVWSSYLGGTGPDAAYGIKISPDSSVYVTGVVGNGNVFNKDTNALNPDFLGTYDGYVARVSPNGNSILNYTYLGTPEKDAGYLLEVDQEGCPHVLGQTFGDYGHSSDSIFFVDREGVFIHKLTPELDSSIYFTTIGDTLNNNIAPNFSPTAFLINECGNVFISGWGGSGNNGSNYSWNGDTRHLPVTENAFSKNSDGADFYLAVFLKDMDTLLFATYFGVNGVDEHVDGGTSRFDESGIVYQSVCAGCGQQDIRNINNEIIVKNDGVNDVILFPKNNTSNYPQPNRSDNCTNGVFKYDLASLDAVIKAEDICAPLTTTFTNETLGGIEYFWDFGDGENITVQDKSPIEHSYQNPGTYSVNMITTDITTCKRKDTTELVITVSDKLIEEVFTDTLCKDDNITFSKYDNLDFTVFKWLPSTGLSNDTIKNPVVTGIKTDFFAISLKDSLGCERIDTLNLFVPEFTPELELGLIPNCKHNSKPKLELRLNYSGNFVPDTILWDINGTQIISGDSSFIFNPADFGTQKVISTVNLCSFRDTASINVVQTEIPNVITPNGDGFNDNFIIKGNEGSGQWSLNIHNRWGKTIFDTDNYKNDWNAPETKESTYFYELISPDGNKCKGWLQVLR